MAIKGNKSNDVISKMDLFDWIDFIGKMKSEGYILKDISENLKLSKDTISRYNKIMSSFTPANLNLYKTHQKGRGEFNSPNGEFNEGWFRCSGLYFLNETYQLKFFVNFKKDKFKWNKAKVQSETAKLKLWQELTEIAKEKLSNIDDDLKTVIELIENDNFQSSSAATLERTEIA